MTPMHTLFLDAPLAYTGEQLRSHWAYRRFDLLGDSAVAFLGPCDVAPEHMRDVEDLKAEAAIRSERMVHLIIEHFHTPLPVMVLRQWLLMARMTELLNVQLAAPRVARRGSDLYVGDRKLTVSIATLSPVSGLIHAGVNVSSRNTPVPTIALDDLQIAPRPFGEALLAAYVEDLERIARAECKVRACP